MVGPMKRVFVAVPLDDDTRHALAGSVEAAVPGGLPGKPVPPPNWHLTLRFIGRADDPTVDRIVEALDSTPLGPPFPVRWGGLGAFPNPGRARVLWIGITRGAPEAALLAERVEDALGRASLEPADRPFRAHLTLARLRPAQAVADVVGPAEPSEVPMLVDRVALFESHLGPGGARYSVVEEFALQ
jgi:RNA 2',3'-cyclic 3'-phosphodiesterase